LEGRIALKILELALPVKVVEGDQREGLKRAEGQSVVFEGEMQVVDHL
jgi:hypothetical protein